MGVGPSSAAGCTCHGVTPEEVEQVSANDPVDLGAEAVDGEDRYATVGQQMAKRYLIEQGL